MAEFLSNDAARIALLFLLFVAVVGVSFGLTVSLGERREVRQRLAGNSTPSMESDGVVPGAGFAFTMRGAPGWQLVTAIEKAGVPLVDTKDATLRSRLVAAGYPQAHAPRVYSLIRLLMVIGLPIGAITFLWASGSSPSMTKLYIIGMIAAAARSLSAEPVDPRAGRPAAAGNHQRLSRCARPDAGLRRGRAWPGSGVQPRRHGNDPFAPAARRAAGRGGARASSRAQSGRCAPADGRPRRRRRNPRLCDAADPVAQARFVDRADACAPMPAEMRERRRMRAEEKAHRLPVLLSIPLVSACCR